MHVCKCIVPSRHGGTLNSRRATSPLVRLVDGEALCSLKIGVESSQVVVTCMVLKATVNDRFELELVEEEYEIPPYMERGCWSFIEGTELPLKQDETATRRDKSEYKQRQDRALATIYYGIDEQYRTLISSTTSPSKAWIILKEQFEPVSRASVI
ncbi:f-box only protein 38 [Trichonephila clavipes]|nr:f-box only protein 38 [Trichonephila clavipes]